MPYSSRPKGDVQPNHEIAGPATVDVSKDKPRLSRGLRIVLAVGLASITAVALLSYAPFTRAAELATTMQPERISELYFNDHENLPREQKAGLPQSFGFHVSNRESQDTTYRFIVKVYENGVPRTIATGTRTIADGQSFDEVITFVPRSDRTVFRFVIELPLQHQEINFRAQS